MTLDNAKRLYAHYIKVGYASAAADLAEKYGFTEEVENKPKEKKKNGKLPSKKR